MLSKDVNHTLRYIDSKCQDFDLNLTTSIEEQENQKVRGEIELWEIIQRSGKFLGFQKFVLEDGTDSGVFLDGTLRITRSNYGSPFSFYGRIASHSVFDQVSNFLKSDNSMV